jgi:hypothetical protein
MKIKIECTVHVDKDEVLSFMQHHGFDKEETVREFVKSSIIGGGMGILGDALFAAGYSQKVCLMDFK